MWRWCVLGLLACGGERLADPPTDAETPDLTEPATEPPAEEPVVDEPPVEPEPVEEPPDDEPVLESRCTIGTDLITCSHQTRTVWTGITGLVPRDVHWQVPSGTPPADGWPTVLVFQGSFASAELFWRAEDIDVFGWWNQGLLVAALLDAGFAVVTPEAHVGGYTFWDTNIPPMSLAWETAPDHRFMLDLFELIDDGALGPLRGHDLYATGISSGGYMTSRMAVAYGDRFAALAVHSGAYATCGGPVCLIPPLPSNHPPTLFVHGEDDLVVPAFTARNYHDALFDDGVPTQLVLEAGTGHAWTDASVSEIPAWFARPW
jgi:dienelactone hydrolase